MNEGWSRYVLAAYLLCGTAVLFSGCATRATPTSASSASTSAPSGVAWISDPVLAAELGPEEYVGGYAIRPPLGYTEKNVILNAPDGKGVRSVWTGPVGANGIAPYLQVDASADNSVLTSRTSSDDEAQIGFYAAGQNHHPLICSTIAHGTINGLAFSRGYWKGAGTQTGKMFHGLVYARIASPNIVTITGRDGDPPTAVPLMEASALTIRKV